MFVLSPHAGITIVEEKSSVGFETHVSIVKDEKI